MATHSSPLVWKIPWMEERGRFQSKGSLKVKTRLSDFTFTHWRRKWQPTPVFLPGESQGPGAGRLVGCRLWGRTRLKRLSSSRWMQNDEYGTHSNDNGKLNCKNLKLWVLGWWNTRFPQPRSQWERTFLQPRSHVRQRKMTKKEIWYFHLESHSTGFILQYCNNSLDHPIFSRDM